MLFSNTTESRFALTFVRAKRKEIEQSLNIWNLDILVASWFVYEFILQHREEFQSAFKESIDIYRSDKMLPEIIDALKLAQKHGAKLQDDMPFGAERIHLLI